MGDLDVLCEQAASFVHNRRNDIIEYLRQLINLRGGSEDKNAVNRVGASLTGRLDRLGFSMERFTPQHYGDHLVFKNHSSHECVVLAGHMDTVFRDYSDLPSFSLSGKRAVGPGTADMRGGLVVALYALECLHHLGLLRQYPITMICNADEERGSSTSREIFQREAVRARWALVFECGGKKGEVVVGRRGKLSARIHVKGQAKHAAIRSLTKASAIEEIARKVIAIEALNESRPGASFNVGTIHGGMANNTVPGEATIEFDIRYLKHTDRDWVEQEVRKINDRHNTPGVRAEIEWTSERPVWEEARGVLDQQVLLDAIADGLRRTGIPYATEFRYGTSDANFFGGQGVATVDGMGPIGFDDHTSREHIIVESLFQRITLTVLVIHRLYSSR